MALHLNPTIAEQWSTFYNNRRKDTYAPANIEEDRKRLGALREDWLKVLRETPARSSDWPITKTELDQLMVLLRWEPSKMWKITKEAEIPTSALDKTPLNTIGGPWEPVIASDQGIQDNPERKLEKGSHHITTLRPSVFPFAYIRTFYNEMDVGSMTTNELKTFAYEQSLKQIDIFYWRAANYCKRLQEALQGCQNNLVASKLYDAFERDHQALANSLNREWTITVNEKMRELGITTPEEDTENDWDKNDEPNNLELAAENLKESIQKQSIFTESNTIIADTESISQASSSSTEKQESVRSTGILDDRMSHHQLESKVEIKARSGRPHGRSNKPTRPVAAREHIHAEFRAHRGADTIQVPYLDNLQSNRPSGPVRTTSRSIRKHNEDSEIWQNERELSRSEFGLRNKAYHRANHPGWNSSKDPGGARLPGLGAQLGAGSANIEITNSTSLNNKFHDSQRRVPNVMPQDLHTRESRTTTGHQSGTPGEETESLSHSMGHRPGYRKQSEPEKPPERFSALDAVPSTSDSDSRPSRSHKQNFPSIAARPSDQSVPYSNRVHPREVAGSTVHQEPGLPREKFRSWDNIEAYPGSDSDDQGQQFPSTNTAHEPHNTTQDIDWQALNQALEHMIEKIYADDAKDRAESYARKMGDPNHNATKVAADKSTEEEEDASLVSSDESELTADSEDLDENVDRIRNPMESSSTLPGVKIDVTGPYAKDLANVARIDGKERSGRKVCWGKEIVYRIDSEVLHSPKSTTAQGVKPRSALKRRM